MMREQNYIDVYYNEKRTAVTLGKFDGFHRGHQLLINRIKELSSPEVESLVFAFDVGDKGLLTKAQERELLREWVNVWISCPLSPEMRKMSPLEFIEEVLAHRLNAKYIVVGSDFRFGYNRKGDVQLLSDCSEKYGYQLDIIPKLVAYGQEIGSTVIKQALKNGEIEKANQLLGYEYEISGVVEQGQKLGRVIGFPTLNVTPDKEKVVPRYGVYGCRIIIDSDDKRWEEYSGICNIGVKPTATKGEELVAEVHVFDFNKDVYEKNVKVKLLTFLRPEKKFNSVEELKEQIKRDIGGYKR